MPLRRLVPLLATVILLSGCALLERGPTAPTDAPVPVSLQAAVEPARRALQNGWTGDDRVAFRFLEGRCAVGAMAVLVFQQWLPGEAPAMALASSDDIAKGILLGDWSVRYDVADPDTDPILVRLLGGREIACP
jgi:hypothetical protein